MVAFPAEHDVGFKAPWYAGARQVALHRYFDADFIDRFQNDITAPDANLFAWENEDRDQATGLRKLRRPIHRTFHVVASEITCVFPGVAANLVAGPALAPEKVASAGFVLRYRDGGAEMGFQLVRGRPAGWQRVDDPKADPDAARQLKSFGIALPAALPPGYTGEEVHPLHPICLRPTGADRSHTILYGYLPIGGAEFTPAKAGPAGATDMQEELPWPFGLADHLAGAPPWTIDAEKQVNNTVLEQPIAALLRMLLTRHQFADPAARGSAENAPLISILSQLVFYQNGASGDAAAVRAYAAAHPTLDGNGQPLTLAAWIAQPGVADRLQRLLLPADPKTNFALPSELTFANANLLVPEAQAASLRAALKLRLATLWTQTSGQWPIPKYPSDGTRFYVVPFVRTIRPDGCPRLNWGAPSDLFLIASAFDPDATRPVLIHMPELTDAKRGLARGAAFALPPQLASFMNGLTGKDKAQSTADGSNPSTNLGVGFICSFSIPAITICAMLLLSIIIALLNIVFFWLPFVKLCLPIPKSVKGP